MEDGQLIAKKAGFSLLVLLLCTAGQSGFGGDKKPVDAARIHEVNGSARMGDSRDPVVVTLDQLMKKAWEKKGLVPAQRATKEEFIRRAFLDIWGRVPTLEEQDRFLALEGRESQEAVCEYLTDTKDDKRSSDFWFRWEKLIALWFSDTQHEFGMAIHEAQWKEFRNGRTDVPFPELLERAVERGSSWRIQDADQRSQLVSHIGQGLLGVTLNCAQCHDHPFESELTSDRFWGLATALQTAHSDGANPGRRRGWESFLNYEKLDLDTRRKSEGKALPHYFGDQVPQPDFGAPWAKEVTDRISKDPLFSKNIVNRIWGTLFGMPLTGSGNTSFFSLDESLSPTNVRLPEVMESLAKSWKDSGSSFPGLVRWLCKSEPFALSSQIGKGNEDDVATQFAARMPLKPLNGDQLTASLTQPIFPVLNETGSQYFHRNLMTRLSDHFPYSEIPTKNPLLLSGSLALMSEAAEDVALILARPKPNESDKEQIDRAFRYLLGRLPSPHEEKVAKATLADPPSEKERAQYVYERTMGRALSGEISAVEIQLSTATSSARQAYLRKSLERLHKLAETNEKDFIGQWDKIKIHPDEAKPFWEEIYRDTSDERNEQLTGYTHIPWQARRLALFLSLDLKPLNLYWAIMNSNEFVHNR